ncbi:MAG: M48 family metalloprotease [Nitrosomonadales bacterium]|nr:M48 family metalloprotease [Nitrosomonadales bacterium]
MRSAIFLFALFFGMAAPIAAFDFSDLGKALETAQKVQQKVKQATEDISEPREIELGGGIAGNLLGAAPLLDDRRVQRYVNHVGRWLALQTERPDLPWQFGVLDDNDINAFAVPGGYVFITRGLLASMKSEAELAGVLAHEISHVLRKHHLQAIKKGARAGLVAELADKALQQGGADPALNKLVSAGTEIYARGLDKNDEFEADRMGVVIAARGGYDPYGLPAVLQTLHGMNPQDSSLALLFKTHPALGERLDLLDNLMPGQFDDFEAQPSLAPRFMQAMGKAGNNEGAARRKTR